MSETLNTRLATVNDREIAQIVSDWTASVGNMLRKPMETVLADFEKGRAVLVFDADRPVAHSAITYIYKRNGAHDAEVGTVFTDKDYRKRGVATLAVEETILLARRSLPGYRIITLANEASRNLFERLGAKRMEMSQLDSEAWEPCALCPRRPVQEVGRVICCDTPYDLSQVQIRRR